MVVVLRVAASTHTIPAVSSAFRMFRLTNSNSFVTRGKCTYTDTLSLLQTKPNKEQVKGKQASQDYPQLYRTDKVGTEISSAGTQGAT